MADENDQSIRQELHVVHLPVYRDNPYQPKLMAEQQSLGWTVTDGGGGGNFLRSVLVRWRPDVLHLHWLHPYILRQGAVASVLRGLRFLLEIQVIRWRGIKVVWTVHNLSNHDERHTKIERWFTHRLAKKCDLIVTHGKFAIDAARTRFGIPASVKFLSVRHPNYCPANYQHRKPCRDDPRQFTVGFLGRIEPYKQVVELVEAFKTLDYPSGRLLIRGKASDDNYAESVTKAIGQDTRIDFENAYVDEENISAFMQSVDLVACPSQNVLTSGSVVLAMSYGLPVVAPADGCIPEEIGETGFTYSNGPNGLFNGLNEALQQRDRWQEMGQLAIGRSKEASPHMVATEITNAYLSLLSAQR